MNEFQVFFNKDNSQQDALSSSIKTANDLVSSWRNPDCSVGKISTTIYDLYKHSQSKNENTQRIAVQALNQFTSSIPSEQINQFLSVMASDTEKMAEQGYRECVLVLKTQMLSNVYIYQGENNCVHVLNFVPIFGDKKFIERGLIPNFRFLTESMEKGILGDMNRENDIGAISVVPLLINPSVALDPEKVSLISSQVGQLLDAPIQSMEWVENAIKDCVHDEYWDENHDIPWGVISSVNDNAVSGLIPMWVSFKTGNPVSIQRMMKMATERHGSPDLNYWKQHITKWFNEVYGQGKNEGKSFIFHKPYANSSANYVVLADDLISKFYRVVNLDSNENYPILNMMVFDRGDFGSTVMLSTELMRLHGKQLQPAPLSSSVSIDLENNLDVIDCSVLYEHIAGNLHSNGIQKQIRSQLVTEYLPPVLPETSFITDEKESVEAVKKIKAETIKKLNKNKKKLH